MIIGHSHANANPVVMKKLIPVCTFFLFGFILPLLLDLSLIFHWKIIILLICCFIMIWTQPPIDGEEAIKQRATDKQSTWLILGFSIISLASTIIEWGYFRKTFTGIKLWNISGLLLLVLGMIIRYWAIRTKRDQFKRIVQITKKQTLIQHGIYKDVRHPSYLGAYLSFIGAALWLDAMWSFVVVIIFMGGAYSYRIKVEEEVLSQHFGENYQRYQKYSWRMIPGVW